MNRRLTPETVREIKLLLRDTHIPHGKIAWFYGVKRVIITHINTGFRWGHVTISEDDKLSEDLLHWVTQRVSRIPELVNKGPKLTDEDVRAIRAEYVKGVCGARRLARKYGVDPRYIRWIVRGERKANVK